MKQLIHISDVHFGKTDARIIEALHSVSKKIAPDLIVISGDFTQRARISEFEEAATFIQTLQTTGLPIVAIPGNHDIAPLYDPLHRMRDPYSRYDRLIAPITVAAYFDPEIAIIGINTVRPSRFKDGRISKRDIEKAKEWLNERSPDSARIIVTHHPLDLPVRHQTHRLAYGSKRAVYALASAGVDLYLSGHHHKSSVVPTAIRYTKKHRSAIALQAGTVSTRSRGELQSFNMLQIDGAKIDVINYLWNPAKKDFLINATHSFKRDDDQWIKSE
jgi:3',5'-cyclic AMP phosphodiesterase CpdA